MSTEDQERSFKAVLTPSRNDFDEYCICHRYSSDVFCENAMCTFSGHGRTQISCRFHPKEKYLLDLTSCPYCSSECIEIFVRSVVREDKGSRRVPQDEELTDCRAKYVVPYLSYEQQPFIKEQEMLDNIYSVKMPREDYKVWRETMKRRCLVVKKKLQLLVNHIGPLSPDSENNPKITRDDLQSMSDLLFDAGRFEDEWRRSTAFSKPVEYPVPPKFEEIKEKPSPMKWKKTSPMKWKKSSPKKKTPEGFLCTPPSQSMRLNIAKESPKKAPQMTPPRNPFYTPNSPSKRQNEPKFNENMDAINKNLGSLNLGKARPSQNTQAKPQTVQQPKNTPTVIYYQSLYTSEK